MVEWDEEEAGKKRDDGISGEWENAGRREEEEKEGLWENEEEKQRMVVE